MKLTTDFSALWAAVHRMGKFETNFDLESDVSPDLELDKELSSTTGLDITLEDLELNCGVLSVKGRQVLLFIPDQGNSIDEVLAGESEGRKFHVADCKTLDSMRQRNRFGRYKATYNTGGVFKVYGISNQTGNSVEGEAELKVCKNCLSYLNYKGYQHGKGLPKSKIYSEFDISEFLSEYSTLFRSMPDRSSFIEKGGYSDDWADVSVKYRASVGFRCEQCGVDLNNHKNLLHTHHISGNKRENHPSNLKAFCLDCHRKQPHHDYMRVTHADMVLLNQLRNQQGLLQTSNWQEVRDMADKALDGLLRYYEKNQAPLPEVGFELIGSDQSVVAELEIAWPNKKKGIAISADDIATASKLGWHVLSVGEALNKMNQ
ncbi:HNH endonuclease [Shewanella algae]|uniref:HNH endonuclease n=1 Tax=Shewanella algae TaxID=38313 RepID=A0A7T8E974_9GAMM|nr:HNH endonuclease signature motif containing protein [Shewanella algae]QQO82126.1 HNH endonuclease [Shewanella algae]